ncbi:MAG: hypothetical protein IIZ32_03665 [Ruminococcus sp.]|nr:hypothetical protein [Ruminococcus sp.]
MKKLIPLLLTALFVLSLAACSKSNTSQPAVPVSSAVSETNAEIPATSPAATDPAAANQSAKSADGIDVDLTAMSSTMVYSEVLNMQQTPDEYIGKIVKMKGPFNVSEIGDNRYFACIIADATACCSTGIEFVWAGDHSYPEDYPEKNQEITVVGTFNTYMEGSSKYMQLKDAEVEF